MTKQQLTTGPNGERRPKSSVDSAVHIMKIATREFETDNRTKPSKLAEYIMDGTMERLGFEVADEWKQKGIID